MQEKLELELLREQLDTAEMILRRTREELDKSGIATVPIRVEQATPREYLICFLTMTSGIVLIISSLCVTILLLSILFGVIGAGTFFYSLLYYVRKIDIPDLLAKYNEYTKRVEDLKKQIQTYAI